MTRIQDSEVRCQNRTKIFSHSVFYILSSVFFFAFSGCIYEAPYWTPDGKKILAGTLYKDEKNDEQYQFFLVDTGTGEAQQLTQFNEDLNGFNPALSPDGEFVSYYYHEDKIMPEGQFELRILDLQKGSSRKVVTVNLSDEKMVYAIQPWSPDGKLLAYENFDPEKKSSQIAVTHLEGSLQAIPPQPGLLPSWSPDGKRLAYIIPKEKTYDLAILLLENASSTVLAADVPLPPEEGKSLLHALVPSWSKDGGKIAYVADQQIAIADLKTGQTQNLTQGDGQKIAPRWAPDNQKIAFMKVAFTKKDPMYGESLSEIFVMNSDGKEARRLTDLGGEAYFPQWSPAGDRLAFLFTKGSEISFLPATVDLDGKVQFLPITPGQKAGLGKLLNPAPAPEIE